MVYLPDKILRELDLKMNKMLSEEKSDSERRKILDEVFDQNTLLAIYRLINRKVLSTLDFPISTGKEANVFHATSPDGRHLAVKIYRVGNADFKNKWKYILGDPRFKNIRQGSRNIILEWTRKEFINLQRLFENGIPVPQPYAYFENVLAMEYLGDATGPAPLLKNTELSCEDAEALYKILLDVLREMIHKAKLVHADFSEFNIILFKGKPVIIDVAQAVSIRHPNAEEFLKRDVENFCRFFNKFSIKITPEEILKKLKH